MRFEVSVSRPTLTNKFGYTASFQSDINFNLSNPRKISSLVTVINMRGFSEWDFENCLVDYHGKRRQMDMAKFLTLGLIWESILQTVALVDGVVSAGKFDELQGPKLPRQLRPF